MANICRRGITLYLTKKKVSILFTAVPMVLMLILTGWAMLFNLIEFYDKNAWLLFYISIAIIILEIWTITESMLVFSENLRRYFYNRRIL